MDWRVDMVGVLGLYGVLIILVFYGSWEGLAAVFGTGMMVGLVESIRRKIFPYIAFIISAIYVGFMALLLGWDAGWNDIWMVLPVVIFGAGLLILCNRKWGTDE